MSCAPDSHVDEFDVMADWTADVLEGRSRIQSIAGACNGSSSPAVLAWLAESLRLDGDTTLLGVGCGLGGALAWAADRYRTATLGVEPMSRAARRGAALFGHRTLIASALDLPLADGAVDAAWLLGVLDTIEDAAAALREVRRVLGPDGRLGLLAYVATGPVPDSQAPRSNSFQTRDELLGALDRSGLVALDVCAGGDLPGPPVDWQVERDHVDAALRDDHEHDPHRRRARREADKFAALLDDGIVFPLLVHAASV